jgi:hypothetical protein
LIKSFSAISQRRSNGDRSLPNAHPYGHPMLRSDGKAPVVGWFSGARIEELRAAWLDAAAQSD